ncbi:MAG: hypothetical protein M3R24_04450, partial [Chloroflexota bacterium]|nr:hypothetical protein [Chloroflexota bacterium]
TPTTYLALQSEHAASWMSLLPNERYHHGNHYDHAKCNEQDPDILGRLFPQVAVEETVGSSMSITASGTSGRSVRTCSANRRAMVHPIQ